MMHFMEGPLWYRNSGKTQGRLMRHSVVAWRCYGISEQ